MEAEEFYNFTKKGNFDIEEQLKEYANQPFKEYYRGEGFRIYRREKDIKQLGPAKIDSIFYSVKDEELDGAIILIKGGLSIQVRQFVKKNFIRSFPS